MSLLNKQRIYNFVSPETSQGARVYTRISVGDADAFSVLLSLKEDLDRNWYFWGYGGYEHGVPQLFQHLASERRYSTIVEVGANIGYFTLLMGNVVRRNGRDAHVHAFEPFHSVHAQLRTNVSLNPQLPITVYHEAVSDADGAVSLFVPADERAKTNASLVPGLFDQKGTIEVSSVRLDTFAASNNIGRVDFVKMDCEGAEPAVIRGAQQLLLESHPDIFCEVLPQTADDLDQQFTQLGYLKHLITDSGPARVDRLVADARHRDYFLTVNPLSAFGV